ncbi:Flp family type IVb pilin [Aliihoeflea sp. PC F10.4]
MTNLLKRFQNDESGATAIEYGLIAALIGVMVIGGATMIGQGLDSTFKEVAGSLRPAAGGGDTTD